LDETNSELTTGIFIKLFQYQLCERLHSLNDSTSAILALLGWRMADFVFIKEKNTLKTIKIGGFRAKK